jgi:P-type Cu+ transporter
VIFISFVTLFSWIGIISSSEDDDDFKDYYCKWCIPFERAIAVLVASCPCGLGLAIPSVIVVALNLGLKNHLLLKKNRVFDRIGQLKGIVFDKTGTLFNRCDELH